MQNYEQEWDVLPAPQREERGYTQYPQQHPRGPMREYGAVEQGMREQRYATPQQRFDRRAEEAYPPQRQQYIHQPPVNRHDRMQQVERRGGGVAVVSQHAANVEGLRPQQVRRNGLHIPDTAVYLTIVSLLAVALYAISASVLSGAAKAGFLSCAGLVMVGVGVSGAYAFRENKALFWGCLAFAAFATAVLAVEMGQAMTLTPTLHTVLPLRH